MLRSPFVARFFSNNIDPPPPPPPSSPRPAPPQNKQKTTISTHTKNKQLVKKRRPMVLRARLATWRAFCRVEIYTARAAAALLIQTQYRRCVDIRPFVHFLSFFLMCIVPDRGHAFCVFFVTLKVCRHAYCMGRYVRYRGYL